MKGFWLLSGCGALGGEAELDSPLLRRGWVRLAADLTRRASGLAVEVEFAGEAGRWKSGWLRWARLD